LAKPQHKGRFEFHPAIETMEVNFHGVRFTSADEVDAFYDEVDRALAESGKRWQFLVDYGDCVIEPQVWERFAARGKNTNITHSLGTVRVVREEELRKEIRGRAKVEMFRANLFGSRDEALVALAERRKRREVHVEREAVDYLRIDDVQLLFGGVRALDGVGFSVQRGEIFSIIGPNGAGKTSMLNVINGFYRPSRGQITFEGRDRTRLGPQAIARLGFARTFQNIALFKGMTTLDNIMSGRLLHHRGNLLLDALYIGPAKRAEIRNREYVERIIDFLEIEAIRKTPVGRLPYGLQKRVELARALAMEPKVLLLDEPMAGMNLEEKQDMVRFILDANDQWGMTMILIEHDMGVVMDISNYVVVLDHGVKIGEGTPDEVRADPVVIRAYLGQE
jgi:branched-chain amino acid transport system ATP-binding protein